MPYYAVIDTNVLVSAMLKWNSVPGNVVSFAFDGTGHVRKQRNIALKKLRSQLMKDGDAD